MKKEKDTYLTLGKNSEGYFKDRGSKFMAFAYQINNEEDANAKILALKKQFHDARHHCYAYILGSDMEYQKANDDGEPSNSAGKPILNQIAANNLTNTLVLVVQYFGGTLLGIGGLINAYKMATKNALENNTIIQKTIDDHFRITYDYKATNEVMRVLKENKLNPINSEFNSNCSFEINVRKKYSNLIIAKLKRIQTVAIEQLNIQ